MSTLLLLIEYDGTNYSGWQIQPNAISVQETIEKALFKLTNHSIKIVGSGRTDAGVHARGHVATAELSEIIIPEEKLTIALNSALPDDIRILNAKYINEKINARFDAKTRVYEYYIGWNVDVFSRFYIAKWKKELNLVKLQESANLFVGKHDFTTFSKFNPDIRNNVCTVTKSTWTMVNSETLCYTIEADHFLYGMVRGLVGAMLDYERGKYDLYYLKDCLEKPDRSKYIYFAPANGLFLKKVNYNDKINRIIYGN